MYTHTNSTQREFSINNTPYSFSHKELGSILGVPALGFSDYIKQQWPSYMPREAMISRVFGPASSSRWHTMSQDGMDVISKILYMLLRANIVPRKEGREKVGILDIILINKLLYEDKLSLPLLIMKHLEHARSIPHHGIPYGALIRRILEYLEVYEEGTDTVVLGKPLDKRCLQQAHFKFEDGSWKSSRPLPTIAEEEEDPASGLASMSEKDKSYVLLSTMISDLARNVNKQFLEIAQQVKRVDDRLTSPTQIVTEQGKVLTHAQGDACWIKKYLQEEEENEETEEEDVEKKEESSSSGTGSGSSSSDKAVQQK